MASNLRVDNILPSNGTHVAIGTASGTIGFIGVATFTTLSGDGSQLTNIPASNLTGVTTGTTHIYVDESEDDTNVYNIPFLDSTGTGNQYHALQVDHGGLMFNPGANRLSAPSLSSFTGNHLFLQAADTTRMVLDVNGPIAIATATSLTAAGTVGTGYSGQTISSRGSNVAAWVGGTQRILEVVSSPCDGSVINSSRGDVTFGNVTAKQNLTTSFVDITGSTISYCPPVGTKQVIYEFNFQMSRLDVIVISHYKLYLDSDEVTKARSEMAGEDLCARTSFKWIFNIGGSADTTVGRVASWNTHKTMKWKAEDYGSSYDVQLHSTNWWNGGGTDQFSMPTLTITAIGA